MSHLPAINIKEYSTTIKNVIFNIINRKLKINKYHDETETNESKETKKQRKMLIKIDRNGTADVILISRT